MLSAVRWSSVSGESRKHSDSAPNAYIYIYCMIPSNHPLYPVPFSLTTRHTFLARSHGHGRHLKYGICVCFVLVLLPRSEDGFATRPRPLQHLQESVLFSGTVHNRRWLTRQHESQVSKQLGEDRLPLLFRCIDCCGRKNNVHTLGDLTFVLHTSLVFIRITEPFGQWLIGFVEHGPCAPTLDDAAEHLVRTVGRQHDFDRACGQFGVGLVHLVVQVRESYVERCDAVGSGLEEMCERFDGLAVGGVAGHRRFVHFDRQQSVFGRRKVFDNVFV